MADDLLDRYRGIIREERGEIASGVALQAGRPPADVARARRLARLTGVEPAIAEAEPASIAAQVRQQTIGSTLDYAPELANFLRDPDNAALAQNDVPRLAQVSSILRPWTSAERDSYLTSIGAPGPGAPVAPGIDFRRPSAIPLGELAARALPETPPVNWRLDRALAGLAFLPEAALGIVQGAAGGQRMWAEITGDPYTAAAAAQTQELLQSGMDAIHPDFAFHWQESVYSGLTSGAQTLAMLPAGGTATILGLSGVTTGQAYGRYRGRGGTVAEASAGALGEGLVEGLTERFSLGFLFSRFGRVGAGQFISGFVGRELGGEEAATFLQDAIDTTIANPNATWADFWAARPQAAIDTAVATLTMAGTIAGAGALTARLQPQARAADEIVQGLAGQEMLDGLMTEAAQSEVRSLDPASFAQFVDSQTDSTPVQNVYIPVGAVRTYLQSEGAETDFFEPYRDQIAEAVRLNGDLVIPIGEATAGLAGTPVWQALREDVRVTPGGMSGREARERGRTFMQELETRGVEIAAEAESIDKANAPAVEVYTQVRAELLAAGRSEREADAVAQIVAARRESAGARLGQTASEYHIANPLTFRQAARGEKVGEDVALIDSTSLRQSGSADLKALSSATASAVDDALAEGQKVRLVVEGKVHNIVGPGLTDDKGQRWGIQALMQPLPGDHARVEISTGRTLFSGARGSTKLYENRPDAIVTLFGSANYSTLVHELGHVFLEEMFRDAALPNAPQELKDDVDRIRKWAAANKVPVKKGVIPVEAHELFARGFERYAMEGKAPSVELRGAFAQFRDWLLDIYKVVKNLRAPITTEIREVMDRMLVTQEAIDANQATALPLFNSAEEAGMTAEEFDAYSVSIKGARDAAYDELLSKTMAAIRRRDNQRMRDQRATVRGDVAAQVNARPEFVALHMLRTGRWLNDPTREAVDIKINTGWLIDTYGEDILNQLPRGLPIINGAGLDGDTIAEMVGMPSGDTLVQTLKAIREGTDKLREQGEKRSLKELMIDTEADKIMAARHGDAMTDGSIEEEAIGAINSARQGEIIAGEMRQLTKRKASLGGPTPYRIAREWARRKVMAGKVKDVASRAAVQRYVRATARAAKAAETAILEGNVEEAFRQKQAQLLNHALLAESKAAADTVDEIVARMRRYAGRKAMGSVDQDYFDRVHELLERFDFRPRSQRAVDEQDSFEAWAARRQAEGFEVPTPPRLADRGEHFSRVDVDTLLELNDAVSALIALGRLKQKMRDGKEEREWNEWRDEAAAQLRALPARKLPDSVVQTENRPVLQKLVELLKIEKIAEELDLDNPNGPFTRLLVQRAADAATARNVMREEVIDPIAAAYFALPAELQAWLGEKATSEHLTWNTMLEGDVRTGQPVTMTRMEWLAVALNTGNLGNLEGMTKGERWAPAVLQAELNRILNRKEAWDFADTLWRHVEKMWSHIVEAERELSGIVPERVEALEIETPFGIYKGGYWPKVFDVVRSKFAENNEINAADDLFGYRSGVGTPKGHTITRTNATGPLTYRLEEVLFTHIERVATRNAYAAWARDVQRVFNNATISGLIDVKLGREYRKQIDPWLRRQINGNMVDKRGTAAWDRRFREFRVNMSIAVMGFSYNTGIAQTLGLGASAARIGGAWVAKGILRTLRNPKEAQRFVYERSPEMARRAQEVNREVVELHRAMREEQGKARKVKRWYRKAQEAAFWHIAFMDRWGVSIPTWIGAFEKGIADGMTEGDASAYGDKTVRMSQGAGHEKDMANLQSSPSEAMRFVTMFYTPFNVMFNEQWGSVRKVKRGDWAGAARSQLWWMSSAILVNALMSGDWPDDEEGNTTAESSARWLLRNLFFGLWSGVPVARDIATVTNRHLQDKYAELQTPISAAHSAVERAATANLDESDEFPYATLSEDPTTGATIRADATAIGYMFGLPGAQVGKTGGFAWDVYAGNQTPETFSDWWSGVTNGRIPEDPEHQQ